MGRLEMSIGVRCERSEERRCSGVVEVTLCGTVRAAGSCASVSSESEGADRGHMV